jgi:hypothetical protein
MTFETGYLDFGNREKDITNQTYEAITGFNYQINDTLSSLSFSRSKPMTNSSFYWSIRVNFRGSNVFS